MRAVHFRIAWIIVLALLRISGTLLGLCFLALTGVVRLFPAMADNLEDEYLRSKSKTSEDDYYDRPFSSEGKHTHIF